MSLDASGIPTYIDVATKVNASANNWTQFTGTIRTLPTTVSLTVFHIVERNGWLQIDDSYLRLLLLRFRLFQMHLLKLSRQIHC